MMRNFVRTKKQKGQGIVEYALLLAFVVGIGIMLNGTNLGGAIKGVYDGVAGIITEEKTVAAKDWGHMNPTDYFDPETRLERYGMDQQSLANLAGLFLNKTKDQVADILDKDEAPGANGETYLGYFVKDTQGNMHFLTRDLALSGDDLSGYIKQDGTTQTTEEKGKTRKYNDRVFNWIQGDYGKWGENGGAYTLDYQGQNNYMVSDYAQEQMNQNINYWQKTDYSPATGGNGVKIKLSYGADQKVDGVKIAVDGKSQISSSTDNPSLYGTYKNDGKMASNGMEVKVKRNQENYEVTTGFNNNW